MSIRSTTREVMLNMGYGLAVLLLTMPVLLIIVLPLKLSAVLIFSGLTVGILTALADHYLPFGD